MPPTLDAGPFLSPRVERVGRRFAAVVGLLAGASRAQPQSNPSAVESCDGKPVSAIIVNAKRPTFGGRSAYWQRLAHGVGLHHTTTDAAVVARFLALEIGKPCTDFRMRESERILRAMPFLASARVHSVPDDSGGVEIEVETVDEIPVIVALGISHRSVSAAELGTQNLRGEGLMLSGHYAKRVPDGTVVGERFLDHQFLNRPYTFALDAEHVATGLAWSTGVGHAYLTDLQRVAWEVGSAGEDRYRTVHRGGNTPDIGVLFRRVQSDIGAIWRVGESNRRLLLGAVGTYLQDVPHGTVAITDTALVSDSALASAYTPQRVTRLGVVAGIRRLRYFAVNGFDALTATQDVARGGQLVGVVSRGVAGRRTDFVGADLYLGAGSEQRFLQAHVRGEGRADEWSGPWSGVVVDARTVLHVVASPASTIRVWSDAAAGVRVNTPFQLDLHTGDAIIPGYGRYDAVGARRLLVGVEDRWSLGRFRGRADAGVVAFATGGRLWSGDAPYGSTTPMLASIGLGLVAAVPPGSKRLWRLDFALPLLHISGGSRFEVRLSSSDRTLAIWTEPRDVTAGRERIIGPDVFAARP